MYTVNSEIRNIILKKKIYGKLYKIALMAEIMPCLPRNSKPFFLIDTMKLKNQK